MSRPEITSRLRAAATSNSPPPRELLEEALIHIVKIQQRAAYYERAARELRAELDKHRHVKKRTQRVDFLPEQKPSDPKWLAVFELHLKRTGDEVIIASHLLPRYPHHALAQAAKKLNIKIRKKRLTIGLKVTRIR